MKQSIYLFIYLFIFIFIHFMVTHLLNHSFILDICLKALLVIYLHFVLDFCVKIINHAFFINTGNHYMC